MNFPFVSIVIPVYNEALFIENCLNSVVAFDYPKDCLEILVVDGNSSDKTLEIVKLYTQKYSYFRLLSNKKKIVPISMNIGIQNAKGDYIIRLDAHSTYPINYITELIKNAQQFKTDNIGTVCLTDVKNKTPKSTGIRFVLSNRFGVGNSIFRIGTDKPIEVDTVPFGCFTKEILQKVGGFDERLVRNQDIEINKRIKKAGGKILLLSDPKSVYYARESFKPFAINNYSNGKWNILTAYYTNNLKSLSLRHYIPLVFILSILIPLIFAFICIKCVLISLSILFIYLMAITYISIINRKQHSSIIFAILAFIVLHFSYGIGSLIGLFNVLYFKIRKK